MQFLLIALLILFVFATAISLLYVQRARAERHQRGIIGPWPIRKVSLPELDPVFAPNEFGPTLATEVRFIGHSGMSVPGGTSDSEAWVLAVLARGARDMFEFGTCTGKTAYLWALNGPPDCRVVTLTLGPDQHDEYSVAEGDDARDVRYARQESAFARFLYTGTEAESRITQLFGDSKQFDETPYRDRFDLVFVDGSHAHSYVASDSEKALRICRPGGLILWHDYRGSRWAPGVFRALNELAKRVPLVHVAGTTFVAHRKPTA